jgi:hypothetical protein
VGENTVQLLLETAEGKIDKTARGDVLVRHFFTVRRNSIIQLFCLVDEHDGNVFTDLVEKLAALANQAVFFFGELYLPFAFGAGKDIKQFLADHGTAPADGNRKQMGLFLR